MKPLKNLWTWELSENAPSAPRDDNRPHGKIDDLRYYNRALDPGEMKTYYQAALKAKEQ